MSLPQLLAEAVRSVTWVVSDLRFQRSSHPPTFLLPGPLRQVPGNSLLFSLSGTEGTDGALYLYSALNVFGVSSIKPHFFPLR